jgi:hypothetical protein
MTEGDLSVQAFIESFVSIGVRLFVPMEKTPSRKRFSR